MNAVIRPKIENHSLMPHFDLPAAGGKRVMTWNYKGQKNLVILFVLSLFGEWQEHLGRLAGAYQQYQDHNAEILVVSQDNVETLDGIAGRLGIPFPLLSDVDGSVTEKYTALTPSVFVIDRYGELYAQSTAAMNEEFPDYQRILDGLHLIELQCPECGVPTWTA
jgi:peroxiredoxin